LSEDFTHTVQTDDGLVVHPKPKPFTYRGFTENPAEKNVVLTIRNNRIAGVIMYKNEKYFLTPVVQFDPSFKRVNSVIIYNAKDSKDPQYECKVGESLPNLKINSASNDKNVYKRSQDERCTEIGVAYDLSFNEKHGGAEGVEFVIMNRLAMVADLYSTSFDIDYQLIELYEAEANEITPEDNFESCLQTGLICSENTVLDDFREWGEGVAEAPNFGTGFNSNPDVATFWTNRNLVDGTNTFNVGYSHFRGICNDRGYNICEESFTTNEVTLTNLWAHELGHSWGASHNNSSTSNLMNATIPNGSVNIANTTINSIADHKASRTCLDIGSCSSTSECDAVLAYPWLDQIINSNECTEIIDYQGGIHHYIYVTSESQEGLYYNGDYYGNPPNPAEYGNEVARWECGCDDPPPPPPSEECDAVSAYPWLNQIINSDECTEIIDYQGGIHHYIYVTSESQEGLYYNGDYYGNPPNPAEYGNEVARWECGCGNPPPPPPPSDECGAVSAYPWLDQIIDSDVCTEIIDYQGGIHHYIYVIANNQGALYYNGTYYGNPPNPAEYGNEVARWECGCGNERRGDSSFLHDLEIVSSVDLLFNLYPNPTKGQISIEQNINNVKASSGILTVFNLAGKIMYQSQLSDQYETIDLSNLSKGMYMVRLKNDRHQEIQKLLIE